MCRLQNNWRDTPMFIKQMNENVNIILLIHCFFKTSIIPHYFRKNMTCSICSRINKNMYTVISSIYLRKNMVYKIIQILCVKRKKEKRNERLAYDTRERMPRKSRNCDGRINRGKTLQRST